MLVTLQSDAKNAWGNMHCLPQLFTFCNYHCTITLRFTWMKAMTQFSLWCFKYLTQIPIDLSNNILIVHGLLVAHLTPAICDASQILANSVEIGHLKTDDSDPSQFKLSRVK